MSAPTAWTADVPDAFLAVWADGDRWRWRYRDTTGRVRRTLARATAAAARSAAATEYKGRVGRHAAPRVAWTPCTPAKAQAHGEDAAALTRARMVSTHVADCVRRSQEERGTRAVSLAPGRRTPDVVPEPPVVERAPVPFAHALMLRCGAPPDEDPAYRSWVRTLPCCVCGAEPTEAHHEPPKGMGGGGSTDYHAVPLCSPCHRLRTDGGRGTVGAASAQGSIADACRAARVPLLLAYFTGPAAGR